MKRKMAALLLCLLTLCLAACGKQDLLRENADGTRTRMEYRSAAPFERAPYFERRGDTLVMTFNGSPWYEASIVDAETAAWAAREKPVAESGNIRAYEASPHAAYDYAYVMKLAGTEDAFILFYTDALPGETYGTDFSTSVRYFTDGTETVPDLDFTLYGDR